MAEFATVREGGPEIHEQDSDGDSVEVKSEETASMSAEFKEFTDFDVFDVRQDW